MFNDFLFRLRALFRRGVVERELDQELQFHLGKQIDKYISVGLTRAEAARRVRLEFGGLDHAKEQCRDVRGVKWIEDLARDLTYGLRMMGQNPGFTAVAVLTIAIGIGASTAIFSSDDAVLFRVLPYQNPERLVQIFQKYLPRPTTDRMPVAPANYLDWQTDTKSVEAFAAYKLANFNLSGGNDPERVRAAQVSPNLFTLLGVSPVRGRGFQTTEDAAGGAVAILSYGLWQRRFGSNKAILGESIKANDRFYIVIGVMPPGFRFPIGWLSSDVEIWTPLVLDASQKASRKDITLDVVARLRPRVTLKQAQASLDLVSQRLSRSFPDTNKDWGTNIMPLTERGVSDYRGLLVFLSLAVGLVLLIACANVANLLLARGVARQRELTVRTALGARRQRLVRQLLTEGVLLSIVGGSVGIAFAYWGIRVLAALPPASELQDLKHVALNSPVLGFSFGATILTGLLFSLFPALTVSDISLHGTLQKSSRSSSENVRRNRVKVGLIVSELALTVALLVCASSVLKSFHSYMSIDPGFDATNVLTMRMVLPTGRYKQPQQWSSFFERVVGEIATIPGVTAAAVGSGAPMEGAGSVFKYNMAGKPAAESMDQRDIAEYFKITPDYFRATGIKLLRGRNLLPSDTAGTPPVAVVNEEFVKREFGKADAIGQRIELHGDVNKSVGSELERAPLQIVGVVADTKEYGLYHGTPVMIYVPLSQDSQPSMALLVKSTGDPTGLLPEIRRRLLKLDPDQPVYNIRSLQQISDENHAFFRFNTWLLTVFATMALLLSLIGIYGVISYAVGQRTKEFGVRLALGASQRQILGLVLKQAGWLSAIGIGLGVALSWPALRLLARSLKESMYLDLVGTGAGLLVATCAATILAMLLASFIPARRATKIDPIEALRFE